MFFLEQQQLLRYLQNSQALAHHDFGEVTVHMQLPTGALKHHSQSAAHVELSKEERHETIKVSTGTGGSSADSSCGMRGLHRATLAQLNSVLLLLVPAGDGPVNHT